MVNKIVKILTQPLINALLSWFSAIKSWNSSRIDWKIYLILLLMPSVESSFPQAHLSDPLFRRQFYLSLQFFLNNCLFFFKYFQIFSCFFYLLLPFGHFYLFFLASLFRTEPAVIIRALSSLLKDINSYPLTKEIFLKKMFSPWMKDSTV